jgi:hypothetical protein
MRTFWIAVSRVKGGSGGRDSAMEISGQRGSEWIGAASGALWRAR